ncbi:hybrid sensor histidine kinase/response regulator [Terrihabitans sp. B22-R8]|uniref:hybrid sensor histidine kinase/response regulator n=1 Tax=Terrihabitans sp. B22-R8 TaxID=3425128 RepID=UPI00403C7DF2
MLHGWAVIAVAFVYFGLLFAVATYGDRAQPAWMSGRARPYIYAFSIAVFCTAFSFFGSVGFAVGHGLEFFALYTGMILAFGLCMPLFVRVARIAKAQNITSVADFIAARYGKSHALAVLVSVGALIGLIPYIALQLRAISSAVGVMMDWDGLVRATSFPFSDIPLLAAVILAGFAVLFGTRRVNANESQKGLMLAVAMESLLKLVAFLAVGFFVTWVMFHGPDDLIERAAMVNFLAPFEQMPRPMYWLIGILLGFLGAFLLPRQFHVTIVENVGEREMRRAAWLVPLYIVALNIFVAPLALAGMLMFGDGYTSPDMYVVALPLSAGAQGIALLTFIGGLSAATAMVIVESVALAIMLSNNIAIPLALHSRDSGVRDMRRFLLMVRRLTIPGILALAYLYHRTASPLPLSHLGMISLVAIAQFAPAFFGGMFWRGANSRGALSGILAGLLVWSYTLLLPSLRDSGLMASHVLADGPLGLGWLRPEALFMLDLGALPNGLFWSLGANIFAYVVGSVTSSGTPMERLQANAFVGLGGAMAQSVRTWHASVSVGELYSAISRYLGEEATRKAFNTFEEQRSTRLSALDEADVHLVRYAEHLLTAAIGASSSRLVLSLLLRRRAVTKTAALKLLDDASLAIQYSRDLLQTALDHAHHGMVVLDRDLRLVCWNREYSRIFSIPPDLLKVGMPVDTIIRSVAERGLYGFGSSDEHLAERFELLSHTSTPYRTVIHPAMRVIETRVEAMPDGGLVFTCIDVTETVEAERALEQRVNERTRELTHLNQELARAKAAADTANFSKTRFLAAASHDILQPLNAARLYVSSLAEQVHNRPEQPLVSNIDAALQSVEEIFSTLLDISRLDAGALKPDITTFQVGDVLRPLELEFRPLAEAKNLRLRVIGSQYWVSTDRRMLRRLLQNLLSNAIKYTQSGSVLLGCRRRGDRLSIEIMDTGLGIAPSKQKLIFKEFQRLDSGARIASGLGLGLSIVERLARVLDIPLRMTSIVGKGTNFRIDLPVSVAPAFITIKPPAVTATSSLVLTGTRVLCIDNEVAIIEGMRILLTGWGCHVEDARDLDQALRVLNAAAAPPDVIIADYHLDHGNGVEAVREIRKHLGLNIPAVLATADRSSAVREAAQRDGLTVLHKPVRPASLRAMLAQFRLARTAAAE